jgi:hypothetical protein
MSEELEDFKRKVREAFEDYQGSEGCSCCEDDEHREHFLRMNELLK